MHRSSASAHYSNYLTNLSPLSSFFFSPVSALDVQKIIEGFKSKSSHINTYSVKILKYLSNLISPILSELINKSLMTGTFPGLFKQARVTPIFKSGCRKDPNNYRPISVLPVLSKVFEKVTCVQVYRYFEHFNFFTFWWSLSFADFSYSQSYSNDCAFSLVVIMQFDYNSIHKILVYSLVTIIHFYESLHLEDPFIVAFYEGQGFSWKYSSHPIQG